MAENLVIVESPAKAKTIEKYLGVNYKVASSFGHISDLPSKNIGIDIENDFKPKYEVSSKFNIFKRIFIFSDYNRAKKMLLKRNPVNVFFIIFIISTN